MTQSDLGIVEKLLRQAEQTSKIHREMAEAKSLRQADNPVRRTDLYAWVTPEQTTEGQAAAIITEMVEALENARNQLQHVNKCHVHLDSTDSLLGEIDTTLAKVRSK